MRSLRQYIINVDKSEYYWGGYDICHVDACNGYDNSFMMCFSTNKESICLKPDSSIIYKAKNTTLGNFYCDDDMADICVSYTINETSMWYFVGVYCVYFEYGVVKAEIE